MIFLCQVSYLIVFNAFWFSQLHSVRNCWLHGMQHAVFIYTESCHQVGGICIQTCDFIISCFATEHMFLTWPVMNTVYPKKYAHGFVVLCFVVVMKSFIINSHEVFIHIHQGCFAGTGAIVRLPQCQWSKPDGYGKISQCITTAKHSKAKTVCIFLGIYCTTMSDSHIIKSFSKWYLGKHIWLLLLTQFIWD